MGRLICLHNTTEARRTDMAAPGVCTALTSIVLRCGASSGSRVGPRSSKMLVQKNGVIFYSHGFATPPATARKKIHGESGEKEGYSPGSKSHDFSHYFDLSICLLP
jgi:hypothetical protein